MGEWVRVARLSELPAGTMRYCEVAGVPVCLVHAASGIRAVQDTCTHDEASLCDGYLEGDVLECPLHQATFDVRDGKVLSPPATVDLRVFDVTVDGDEIRVREA
jgi:nitrite reductase/ring-hydroxylating ferredoxin subunit